ncbi:MAG: dTDP-glucose 4,6-dehydratase [bacterium]
MQKKLFVTGGAGFIGSCFVRYWLTTHPDDQVVVYDQLTYAGNKNNLKTCFDNPHFHFVQGDICDAALVNETLETNQSDTIVHFAAETHVDRSIEGPAVFIQTNVVGTQVLLDAAKNAGNLRFHHISTDEVFGSLELNSQEKFSELTPYDPRSPYSASKAASDHLVRAYFETYGLPITISNCSNNYGPFHHPEKLIPLAITRALSDQEIPIYGDGLNVRDWIYVEDHAKGIELIIQKGRIGETYLLGGNGERTNLVVLKKILEIMGKPENLIVHVGDRKGHDRRYAIDYTKAQTELGFTPEKQFEIRLAETIKWFTDNQWWWQDLKKDADVIAEKYLEKRY